jgi:hypothetical protein
MATDRVAQRWRVSGAAESAYLANWLFLQWMLLRRVFAGHSPFRVTGLMALGNLAVGLGGFYFMTIVIGQGSARTHGVYAEYGGAASFMAVGVAMNQLLTVGMTSIAHAIVDERNQGTLGYWATTGRRMVPLVLRASMGEFLIACVNAVATFVLLVLLFPVHFDIQPVTFLVVLATSLVAIGGVGMAAAGLYVGGHTGQNPITWAWGLTTTFIAGVFVPVIVFDNPLVSILGTITPSTHALMATRSAVLRGAALTDATFLSQWLPWLAFAIVIGPVGVWVFERGLRRAFRSGKFVQT